MREDIGSCTSRAPASPTFFTAENVNLEAPARCPAHPLTTKTTPELVSNAMRLGSAVLLLALGSCLQAPAAASSRHLLQGCTSSATATSQSSARNAVAGEQLVARETAAACCAVAAAASESCLPLPHCCPLPARRGCELGVCRVLELLLRCCGPGQGAGEAQRWSRMPSVVANKLRSTTAGTACDNPSPPLKPLIFSVPLLQAVATAVAEALASVQVSVNGGAGCQGSARGNADAASIASASARAFSDAVAKGCGGQSQASTEAVQQKFAAAAASAQASASASGGSAQAAATLISSDIQPAVATAISSALSSCKCGGGGTGGGGGTAPGPSGGSAAAAPPPSAPPGGEAVAASAQQEISGGGDGDNDDCKQVGWVVWQGLVCAAQLCAAVAHAAPHASLHSCL
jgi:hypothetical protein